MTVFLHFKVGSKLLGVQSKKKERHACYKNTPKLKKKKAGKKRDARTYNWIF